ncbi:hypothetical protein [Bacillus thuringiensis]|uniref:hypothetical protein n=1 Tax=Bacillus thuringiensis TaxID=1428 RepID=UPI00103B6398|nr:hypothetical protein [Bacillus thuringiensis]MCU4844736.1 hypothetical protein [Bacillus cereus]TBX45051.1 hypothetical protein E0M35_10445 [Bacillus thuringiensis]
MKKFFSFKVEFTIRAILLLLLSTLVVGILMVSSGLIFYSLNSLKIPFAGDLVATFGNIAGGLIGGIVAYIVAAYQVQKTLEFDAKRNNAGNSAILRLIRNELNSNKKILGRFKPEYLSGNNSFLSHVSVENWDRCSTNIGIEISDNTLDITMSVYRKISLIKSNYTLTEQEYDILVSDIENAIDLIRNDLDRLLNV